MEALDDLAVALRARLIERARAGESGADGLDAEVRELVEREAGALPEAERESLRERVLLLATGLGPLEPLLSDPAVDEVMVNGPEAVYVERRGRLERTGVSFAGEAELMHAIERVLAPLGRRVDEASPLCDARLADGSRVNVVIPPLSLSGPCLTVRRFRRQGFSLRELVAGGTLPGELAELLALCVAARASVLVSGGTGSGKTTTLNALSGAIPGEERIVTIEDAAELRLRQRHVVRLEARPPNLEGRGEITIRQLVVNALRMRPDRIVVGEVRGAEALDMLQALNTGHDGSLTTVHANSPADALRRVETLALMAGVGLPHAAVRDQVASALDVVVHQARLPDGSRVVESVTEVVRVAGGAGTRELWTRGGRLRRPAPGPLAARLERLRGGGASVRAPGTAGERRRVAERGTRCALVSAAAALAFFAGAAAGCGAARARRASRSLGRWRVRLAGPRAGAGLVEVLVRAGREGRDPGAAERRRLLARRVGGRARRRRDHGRAAGGIGAERRRTVGRRAPAASRAASATERPWTPGWRRWRWRSPTPSAAGARCARPSARRPAGSGVRRDTSCAARGPSSRRERPRTTRSRPCDCACARRAWTRSWRPAYSSAARAATSPGCSARAPGPWRTRRGSRTRCGRPPRRRASRPSLVVLMPVGGGLLAELASPGWFLGLWSSFLTAWLVGIALVLQVAAAVLTRRLGRVRW